MRVITVGFVLVLYCCRISFSEIITTESDKIFVNETNHLVNITGKISEKISKEKKSEEKLNNVTEGITVPKIANTENINRTISTDGKQNIITNREIKNGTNNETNPNLNSVDGSSARPSLPYSASDLDISKPLVTKCCNFNEHFVLTKNKSYACEPRNQALNERSVFNHNDVTTGKKAYEAYIFVEKSHYNVTCTEDIRKVYKAGKPILHNMENGELQMKLANHIPVYFKPDSYCMEIFVHPKSNKSFYFILSCRRQIENTDEISIPYYILLILASAVSSLSLGAVLVIYFMAKKYKTLFGALIMSFVFSSVIQYFTNCIFRTLQLIEIANDIHVCEVLGLIVYFSMLSSFSWMSAMIFQMWRTSSRPLSFSGSKFEWCKFLYYNIYGWGLPSLLTINVIVLNKVDMSAWRSFITPRLSSTGGSLTGIAHFLYQDVPILIFISINVLFALMTSCNFERLSKGGDRILNNEANKLTRTPFVTQKKRLQVHIKLAVLMGLNWILDTVSIFYSYGNIFFDFVNVVNMLMGFCIFVIFVLKEKSIKVYRRNRCSRSSRTPLKSSIRSSYSSDENLSETTVMSSPS